MLKFLTVLFPIKDALIGQPNAIITMAFDLSILTLLIFSLIRFWNKIRRRISELEELTNQLEQREELRKEGKLPAYVKDELDAQVFATQPKEFREAWAEFSSVLITEEKTEITYKSDESSPYYL